MRKWWPRDAKWLQAHPDCGSSHSLKECPPVSYPHPPQRGAPTVMFNNHSKIGAPFTSPPLALSPHLEGPGIITIESETSPQFSYHGTPTPCSDCWRKASRDYPALSFPSQNLTPHVQCCPRKLFGRTQPKPPTDLTQHGSPHQCILAPLASQTSQGPFNETPFSPGLERSEGEMTEHGAPPTPLHSILYNEPWGGGTLLPILEPTPPVMICPPGSSEEMVQEPSTEACPLL